MQPKRFPIGFWNGDETYPPGFEARVAEWADLGFSLAMTPPFDATPETVTQVRRLLDLAQASDIEVIVRDNRTHGPGSPWGNPPMLIPLPENYAEKVAGAVRDFGDHPAVWGFYVVDEPLQGSLPGAAEACRIIRESEKVSGTVSWGRLAPRSYKTVPDTFV